MRAYPMCAQQSTAPVVEGFEPPNDVPAGGFPDVRFLVVENLRLHLSETFVQLPSQVSSPSKGGRNSNKTTVLVRLSSCFEGSFYTVITTIKNTYYEGTHLLLVLAVAHCQGQESSMYPNLSSYDGSVRLLPTAEGYFINGARYTCKHTIKIQLRKNNLEFCAYSRTGSSSWCSSLQGGCDARCEATHTDGTCCETFIYVDTRMLLLQVQQSLS